MPADTPVAPRTSGLVRDSQSGKPIEKATVFGTRAGFRTRTRTDRTGRYSLPVLNQWHFLVYLGSPGVFPTPWWCNRSRYEPYTITVTAPGYHAIEYAFVPKKEDVGFFYARYRPEVHNFALAGVPKETAQHGAAPNFGERSR